MGCMGETSIPFTSASGCFSATSLFHVSFGDHMVAVTTHDPDSCTSPNIQDALHCVNIEILLSSRVKTYLRILYGCEVKLSFQHQTPEVVT